MCVTFSGALANFLIYIDTDALLAATSLLCWCAASLQVKPGQRQDQVQQADAIYHFEKQPVPCPGCKLHN
jgi:hypothetical protein